MTLPLVSFSIWKARTGAGMDLPRRMREACDRLHPKALASQTSSLSLSDIQVSRGVFAGSVMARLCTRCT